MRKHTPSAQHRIPLLTVLTCAALAAGGCATPGPNHAYLARRAEDPIIDRLPGVPDAEISTYLTEVNELYGIAYDPFTDHLFLRVCPGNFVRVIDRPAGKIKRSFYVNGLPPGHGDLAIRSIDRHLFFAEQERPELLETTLDGRTVRKIALEGLEGSPAGVAYDQKHDHLLILKGGGQTCVTTYDLAGKPITSITLDRNVRLTSLAFDSVAREFYVPLADEPSVGVFNAQGRFLRSLTAPGGARDYVDVGPRSFLRLF